MEHLPAVQEPFNPITIPFLGGPEYDGLDFEGYPTRRGFDAERLISGDLHGHSKLETAQFLQAWLYFGMLHETFKLVAEDPPVPPSDFLRVEGPSDGTLVLTTAALPGHLSRLYERVRQGSEAVTTAYYQRFKSCMGQAYGVWRQLMILSPADREAETQILGHEILLSIQILGAALDIGICEVFDKRPEYTWRIVARSEWLMNRMVAQGWCPTIVNQISRPCATFLYYASLLGPPNSDGDHSGCTFQSPACVASNVKATKKYVRKHVSEDCECGYIDIPTGEGSEVAAAISRDEIPVVQLHDDGSEITFEIHSYSDSNRIPYTALSHVWADGLGDPNHNRLHICQMRRLVTLLRSIPPHNRVDEISTLSGLLPVPSPATHPGTTFWMDTLCVPVDNEGLRSKAIIKMRQVYERASRVLVLNSELMKYSTDVGYQQVFTRITCSNWLRRLWTLQESLLNPNLVFQFRDRSVYAGAGSELFTQQSQDNKTQPWDLVAWECHRFELDFLSYSAHLTKLEILGFFWGSLAHRTTSRGGDEPLCVAILLDLDVEALQQEPDANSVKKFWALHRDLECGIPTNVLFVPGPKLQGVEGYGWAPASVMDLQMGRSVLVPAQVTERGLAVQRSAFVLHPLQRAVKSIIPLEVDGVRYYIRVVTAKNSRTTEGMDLQGRKNLVMLMLGIKEGEDSDTSRFDVGLGVIAEGLDDDDDGNDDVKVEGAEQRRARYLLLVTFVQEGTWLEKHPSIPWSAAELEEKLCPPIGGEYLPPSQKWLIS